MRIVPRRFTPVRIGAGEMPEQGAVRLAVGDVEQRQVRDQRFRRARRHQRRERVIVQQPRDRRALARREGGRDVDAHRRGGIRRAAIRWKTARAPGRRRERSARLQNSQVTSTVPRSASSGLDLVAAERAQRAARPAPREQRAREARRPRGEQRAGPPPADARGDESADGRGAREARSGRARRRRDRPLPGVVVVRAGAGQPLHQQAARRRRRRPPARCGCRSARTSRGSARSGSRSSRLRARRCPGRSARRPSGRA